MSYAALGEQAIFLSPGVMGYRDLRENLIRVR